MAVPRQKDTQVRRVHLKIGLVHLKKASLSDNGCWLNQHAPIRTNVLPIFSEAQTEKTRLLISSTCAIWAHSRTQAIYSQRLIPSFCTFWCSPRKMHEYCPCWKQGPHDHKQRARMIATRSRSPTRNSYLVLDLTWSWITTRSRSPDTWLDLTMDHHAVA